MVYYLIIGAYIILYIGMILYDLLHKDPAEVQPKQDEEEIDITQEAEQFKPVEVTKDMPNIQKPVKVDKETPSEKPKEEKPKAEKPKEVDSPKVKVTTVKEPTLEPTKPEPPHVDKVPEVGNNPTEAPQQKQELPAEQRPAETQKAPEQEPESHEKSEESIPNPTQYSGAKKYEDLEKEIEALSQSDPEMREAAYEIMKIDSEQA